VNAGNPLILIFEIGTFPLAHCLLASSGLAGGGATRRREHCICFTIFGGCMLSNSDPASAPVGRSDPAHKVSGEEEEG